MPARCETIGSDINLPPLWLGAGSWMEVRPVDLRSNLRISGGGCRQALERAATVFPSEIACSRRGSVRWFRSLEETRGREPAFAA
jgi:hypothetical protein